MSNTLKEMLLKHFGHHVTIATYGDIDDPFDVALECEDCNEIILDSESYDLKAAEEE